MKMFKMTSRFFSHLPGAEPKVFDETDPPWWLVSKEFKWWWDKHALALDVGETIETDFQCIERIA